MLVLFSRESRGPVSGKKTQMLVQSFANGWRQVNFGLTVPNTVPFTGESLIIAQSKHHSQLELTRSSKIYVSANAAHLFYLFVQLPKHLLREIFKYIRIPSD